jgi:hypothetical protein
MYTDDQYSHVSGASELRNVLAKLDTKQQVLIIMGHAVPMPAVVCTPYHLDGVLRGAWLYRGRSVAEETGEESQGVGAE